MSELYPLPEPLARHLIDTARGFGMPGFALAVLSNQRRHVLSWGEEPAGSGRAATVDTWFSVASLGKHVTALAALQALADRGLTRETQLGDVLPRDGASVLSPVARNDTSAPTLPAGWARRHIGSLLDHTSGLPEYLSYTAADAVPDDRAGFFRAFGHLPDAFDEGEGWLYTNTNYILLGFVVAELSGMPYAAAVQRLFDRADGGTGMAVASPAWVRAANASLHAGSEAVDPASAGRQVIGDGDIAFTARGAAAWLDHLLGAEARRPRLAPHDDAWTPTPLNSGRSAAYANGWFVEPFDAAPGLAAAGTGRLVHHAGHYDGYTALGLLSLQRRSGVIAMCNLAPRNTRAIRYLAQLALEGLSPGATAMALPPLPDGAPALTANARAQLLRDGTEPDLSHFAPELLRVAAHGSNVRPLPNAWAGTPPLGFELVSDHPGPQQRLRRYRLRYADRCEHLLVGTTATGDRIHWAWPL